VFLEQLVKFRYAADLDIGSPCKIQRFIGFITLAYHRTLS